MEYGEEKVVFEEDIVCPHCKKAIELKRIKKCTFAPEKGEYEEELYVSKAKQTKLSN